MWAECERNCDEEIQEWERHRGLGEESGGAEVQSSQTRYREGNQRDADDHRYGSSDHPGQKPFRRLFRD